MATDNKNPDHDPASLVRRMVTSAGLHVIRDFLADGREEHSMFGQKGMVKW